VSNPSRRAGREGDTLVVPKLDLLARSVPDARAIGDDLAARGIKLLWAGRSTTPPTRWARCSSVEHRRERADRKIGHRGFRPGMRAGGRDGFRGAHRAGHPLQCVGVEFTLQPGLRRC
jgi:hypothetical protein